VCVCVCVLALLCSACVPAPAKPTQRPEAVLGHGGVAMVTHRSITIRMPACFYRDDNGPITKIQVIVAESGGKTLQKHWRPSLRWIHLGIGLTFGFDPQVESCFTVCHFVLSFQKSKCMQTPKGLTSAVIWLIPSLSNWLTHPVTVKDVQNLTNWKNAFFDHPAPYLTDKGFPNPPCSLEDGALRTDAHVRGGRSVSAGGRPALRQNHTTAGTYVIGRNVDCMKGNNTGNFCNGRLKPNTVYVWVQHTQPHDNLKFIVCTCFIWGWHWTGPFWPGSSSEPRTLMANTQTLSTRIMSKLQVFIFISEQYKASIVLCDIATSISSL